MWYIASVYIQQSLETRVFVLAVPKTKTQVQKCTEWIKKCLYLLLREQQSLACQAN